MPITINGEAYYRTKEVCQMVGISRLTLLRWLSSNILQGLVPRDRRGWRLFTEADISRIRDEANKIQYEQLTYESDKGGAYKAIDKQRLRREGKIKQEGGEKE